MSQLNDCMLAAVGATSESQLNDGLRAHYLANGATGANGFALQDLEWEFLVANGATPGEINDMWAEVLPPVVGFSAQLNDMLIVFWCSGGTFAPPAPPAFVGPIPDQTAFEQITTTLDCKPYFSTGGYISSWSLINAPTWATITAAGILRMSPGIGDADHVGIQVQGNNATGPAATSNAFNIATPANVAITFNPLSQYGEQGQNVVFSVAATAATGYQWQKDGVDIPGAASFVLTVPVDQVDDLAKYKCRVIGHGGITADTTEAELICMQRYNNLADGSGSDPLSVSVGNGNHTLSMSGTGETHLAEETANVEDL